LLKKAKHIFHSFMLLSENQKTNIGYLSLYCPSEEIMVGGVVPVE